MESRCEGFVYGGVGHRDKNASSKGEASGVGVITCIHYDLIMSAVFIVHLSLQRLHCTFKQTKGNYCNVLPGSPCMSNTLWHFGRTLSSAQVWDVI